MCVEWEGRTEFNIGSNLSIILSGNRVGLLDNHKTFTSIEVIIAVVAVVVSLLEEGQGQEGKGCNFKLLLDMPPLSYQKYGAPPSLWLEYNIYQSPPPSSGASSSSSSSPSPFSIARSGQHIHVSI